MMTNAMIQAAGETTASAGTEAAEAVEFATESAMWWADLPGVGAAVEWLQGYPPIAALVGLALLATVAWLAQLLVRRYLLRLVHGLAKRSANTWYELLFDHKVIQRLVWAVPLIIVTRGLEFVPFLPASLQELILRLARALLVLVALRAFAGLLAVANDLYNRLPMAKDRPIKGLLQIVSVVAHIAGGILIIAALLSESPLVFLGGLGAMSAVTMLVFRDTLLSLVAGVQLTANDLIRVGDWIEMPQFNADGDVIDIALNSVRVQNWDRTTTVIPAHKFLENSFKNWRGMFDAGGRRIKRSLYVDMSTIRFLTDEEIDRFSRFLLLRDYIARKVEELEEYNREHVPDPSVTVNARRLTNVGTLRAYITSYLRQHPGIHQDMTFLVRQLQPTPEGLPIEIYVFTNDTRWAFYEGIQADIFDHILAITPEFGLRVFQNPSGNDVARALEARAEPLQPA